MTYESILYASADGIARLTLNRPDRLNSLNAAMHAELRDALKRVTADGSRVLVLTGAGRGFCAGQDLGDRQVTGGGARADLGESIERNYKPLILALLACDLVVAASSASFIQAFSRLGLVPDSGATWFLPRLVGRARALGLAMLGEKLSAADAAQWGLIWRCVDDAAFAGLVGELARTLAAGPTRGLVRTRQAIDAAATQALAAQLDLERDFQRELGYTDDYAEGVAAFAEKRAARFSGR
jgi:2-(1,2-epoxy-1,2-dihydrophenyl)acetyl-CoA isomerase